MIRLDQKRKKNQSVADFSFILIVSKLESNHRESISTDIDRRFWNASVRITNPFIKRPLHSSSGWLRILRRSWLQKFYSSSLETTFRSEEREGGRTEHGTARGCALSSSRQSERAESSWGSPGHFGTHIGDESAAPVVGNALHTDAANTTNSFSTRRNTCSQPFSLQARLSSRLLK